MNLREKYENQQTVELSGAALYSELCLRSRVSSLFLFGCVGCVEFEKDNVSVLHDVVPALLPVFPSSL